VIWNGKVLIVGGKVAMDDACCCAYDCADTACSPTPSQIKVVFSGISNCGCVSVLNGKYRQWTDGAKSLNSTFYLDQCSEAEACVWQYEGAFTDMDAADHTSSDCTDGSPTLDDGKIWIYLEKASGAWIIEGYLELSTAAYTDTFFSNLGHTASGCNPQGLAISSQINQHTSIPYCGQSTGAVGSCDLPSENGNYVRYGGTATLTAIWE